MTRDGEDSLVFEDLLDAPPEKVWRALTIPDYLAQWLGGDAEAPEWSMVASEPNRSITYRWREAGADEGLVTFELEPADGRRTHFRLIHSAPVRAANDNGATMMMAA